MLGICSHVTAAARLLRRFCCCPQRTEDKITTLSDAHWWRPLLLEHIHPSQLPRCYGGMLECPLNEILAEVDSARQSHSM